MNPLEYEIFLPDDYPDTPIARIIRNDEHSGQAAYIRMSVKARGLRHYFYKGLDEGYNFSGLTEMPLDKKVYAHLHMFIVNPARWEIQQHALPGELDAFRGKGKWMLCNAVSYIINNNTDVKPEDIVVTLEASGADCRFTETPSYEKYSNEDIMEFFRLYFGKSVKEIRLWMNDPRERLGRTDRQILTHWLCLAKDALKLIEYYKTYGFVPLMGEKAGVQGTFMWTTADKLLSNCNDLTTPDIYYTGPPISMLKEEEIRSKKRQKF